jgi:Na+/H+ antiporter NhaA
LLRSQLPIRRLSETYNHLWGIPLTIGIAPHELSLTLHEWINDTLMVVFFLLVGLEINRELLAGDLSSHGKQRFQSAAQSEEWLCPQSFI